MLGGKLVILAGLFDKLKTDISGIPEMSVFKLWAEVLSGME